MQSEFRIFGTEHILPYYLLGPLAAGLRDGGRLSSNTRGIEIQTFPITQTTDDAAVQSRCRPPHDLGNHIARLRLDAQSPHGGRSNVRPFSCQRLPSALSGPLLVVALAFLALAQLLLDHKEQRRQLILNRIPDV